MVAPAGSGKTVLLDQWLEATGGGAKLSLDARHDDPVVLARDLTEALRRAHPSVDPGVAALTPPGSRSLGPLFVEALVGELAALAAPVRLGLDDAHLLTNTEVVADIGALVRDAPAHVGVAVATRRDLPLGLGRARLRQVVDVRAADLAFDEDEARAMIGEVAGTDLPEDALQALVAKTDGWAAGLQLAALSLQGDDDARGFVDRFTGDNRLVVEYLTDEVLDQQDDATRAFLLRTSVLTTLTPEVCAALVPGVDARAMIEELERRSMFLARTDDTAELRYHHLFAELMRYHLRAEQPGLERELRQEAARHLLARGDVHEAVEQLLAADLVDEAAATVHQHGHVLFERGEAATLVTWLEAIAAAQPGPAPTLLVDLIAAQAGADAYVGSERTHRALHAHPDATAAHLAAADALYSLRGFADLPVVEVRRLSEAALAAAAGLADDEGTRFLGIGGRETVAMMATYMAELASLLQGEVVDALDGLAAVVRSPAAAYPLWRINGLGALAIAQAWTGRTADARRSAATAIETAQQVGIMHHRAVALPSIALALVALDTLDLDGAALHLDSARRCTAQSQRTAYIDLIRVLEVRHVALTRGPQAALDALRASAPTGIPAPLLATAAADLEARLLLATGSRAAARAGLDRAGADLPAARIDVALVAGDAAGARAVLDRWEPDPRDEREGLEHTIRAGTVLHAEGRVGAAVAALVDAVERAEPGTLRRPFLDAPTALDTLARAAPARTRRFVDDLAARRAPDAVRHAVLRAMVDPLTDREFTVLEFLPSRLRYEDIAATLYISINTLKSHLRSIYRKLEVSDREGAVSAAARLGLI